MPSALELLIGGTKSNVTPEATTLKHTDLPIAPSLLSSARRGKNLFASRHTARNITTA